MRVGRRWLSAVDWDARERAAVWIDQNLLPFRLELRRSRDPEELARAIETMAVRGAPTIGAAAALALALAWMREPGRWARWKRRLARTRPTAVNLFRAIAWMDEGFRGGDDPVERAAAWLEREVRAHEAIGERAADMLARAGSRILTHCNAGWLAAVDWGTALAGIYRLHEAGERLHVWVDETRPRNQGARLTIWELQQAGVPCTLQVDAAAAALMRAGEVDAVIVGADRIAGNGDVANKIGTYMLACLARLHGVPFYVAAPTSTLDAATPEGAGIPIEERAPGELLFADGVDEGGRPCRVRTGTARRVRNPAFDVTPHELVDAIVTEQGIWRPAHG